MHSYPTLTADTLLAPDAVAAGVREADLAGSMLRGVPRPVRDLVTDRVAAALQSQLADIDVGEIVSRRGRVR